MNYLGDWGTQVLVFLILINSMYILTLRSQFVMIATGYEKYVSQGALEKDAIRHLFDVYVKVSKDAELDPEVKVEATKWFKRMEDGDEDTLQNWRVWREMSVKKYVRGGVRATER